ncbi:hypothetical protein Bpfe_001416 [Biomphalaria pfeifferi]|uniref:Uncharacterized protein n=1 Tax=Biomphalaria pfeifferi TaxID=112525 RepID=A0AAD8CBG6_BIOPF|nr:hypothetical protein Bpfe_001416 [Biomphalaria pfeifferi]
MTIAATISTGYTESKEKRQMNNLEKSVMCVCLFILNPYKTTNKAFVFPPIIIEIGIDECQLIQAKSKQAREIQLKLEGRAQETYHLDMRLLVEVDCYVLHFDCNVSACETAAPLRKGVC